MVALLEDQITLPVVDCSLNRYLRVNDYFACGTTEENIQAIEHIPTQDSFLAAEFCLKLARIFLTIQPDPNQEAHRHRHATRDSTDQAGNAESWVKFSCWQSDHGRVVVSAPVSGMTRSRSKPAEPLTRRNSALITGSAALE